MNKTLGTVLVVILVIATAGAYMFPKGNTVVERIVGSVTGPDSYFEYVANNDLQKFGQTVPLRTATTTVCAIKSPTATSTLTFGGVKFTVSSTTASTVTLAKSSSFNATTTLIGQQALAANAQGTIVVASSTPSANATFLDGLMTFAPNTYFVVGMQGGTGTFSPVGSCSAEFVRI